MRKTTETGVGLLLGPQGVEISSEDKRALVERIVTSPLFNKSGRLSSFLLHVCEFELQGRSNEISEQQIGETIFSRSQNYDPSMDGIVRSHASRLRHRLEQYFTQEGGAETIRLHIPRGAYVPVFGMRTVIDSSPVPQAYPSMREPSPYASMSPTLSSGSATPGHHGVRRAGYYWLMALGLIAVSIVLLRHSLWLSLFWPASSSTASSEILWHTLFTPGRETLFVVGDAGANMFENMAKRQITTDEYSSKAWTRDPLAQTPPGFSWNPIATRTYTPDFAVGLAARVARLSEVADGQLSVLFARNLRLDNLKDSQAILLGGPNYDPWEMLLESRQNFHMVYDGRENSISILNAQPKPGEPAAFKWSQTSANSNIGYSLIVLTHNLNANGRVLMLQGTTAQGDQAAAEFLFDPTQLDPILREATTAEGKLNDFEIVIETSFVAGGTANTRMAAFRVHRGGASTPDPRSR
ncbi:MAG: Adenylate cyclase [Acidobacteriaceae bacterium]|nr:Adenylate cyclase [Acidobacteriaceae bacterium]